MRLDETTDRLLLVVIGLVLLGIGGAAVSGASDLLIWSLSGIGAGLIPVLLGSNNGARAE